MDWMLNQVDKGNLQAHTR